MDSERGFLDLATIAVLAVVCSIGTAQPSGRQDTQEHPLLTASVRSNLLGGIDLSQPQLAPAHDALSRGDRTAALRAIAQYYRSRNSVGWNPQLQNAASSSPQSHAVAESAVHGKVQGGTVPLAHSFSSGDIDWHFDATAHTAGQAQNNEWQWQLNRVSFWSDLAGEYRSSRDERYAQTFSKQLTSWLIQCPRPDHMDNSPGSTWRTIDTGIRTSGPWIDAFYAFRDSPSMTDDELLAMVNAFLEQGRYLRQFHTKLNWLTMEMSGLYAIGAEFPEFKEASDWRQFAANTMNQEVQKQFLPDGAQEELSSGYQQVAIDSVLRIIEVARWTNRESELPAGLLGGVKNAFEYEVGIVAPDRQLPKINDAWPVPLPPIMRKALNYYPSQPEFQWFATDGRQGAQPPFTSIFFNRSGIAAMRSGWQTDANYLLFRAGPLGMGHQEQEALNIELWAFGREMIFTGGGGNYDRSMWRTYATSAYSHNTVLVDGLAENETLNLNDPEHDPNQKSQGPIDLHWQSNSVFDFASKDYEQGYGPSHLNLARERREILYLKPDIFIVADRLVPNDTRPHEYQARWQLLTTQTHLDPSTGVLETRDAGSPNLAVVPLVTRGLQVKAASAQKEPELLGWDVRKDMDPEVVPATTLLHDIRGQGPQLILTMLLPLRPNEEDPISGVQPSPSGTSATVKFKSGRVLLVDCSGASGIKISETLGDGRKGASINTGSK